MTNPHASPCPHCKEDLDGGDVYEQLLRCCPSDILGVNEAASQYGWTEENKKRFNRRIGIYDQDLDIVIGYVCPKCNEALPWPEN